MSGETRAFVDEYDNPTLATEVEGASKFFLASAVILGADQLDSVGASREAIRPDRFWPLANSQSAVSGPA